MQITVNFLLNQFIIIENEKQTILSLDEVGKFFEKKLDKR